MSEAKETHRKGFGEDTMPMEYMNEEARRKAQNGESAPHSSHCSLASMPFAYKRGNNPNDESATYYCHECGLELCGDEVGFVAAGPEYANGEWARCPACGEENSVDRGRQDDE